jgi:GT2 family glycosyltransferase
MEDVDLAFRGRRAGWTCRYVPAARVVHIHGGTSGVKSDTAIYYGNRNIGWFVIKNYPKKILFLCMPFIVGRNIGAIPYFLMQGKLRTILRSKIDLILGLNEMLIKRRAMQKTICADTALGRWILPWAKNSLSYKHHENNIS